MSAALTITDAAILDDGRASTASIRAVGGRIAEVGAVNPQDGDTVVHAHGRTVVPGLIDAHFHAYGIGLDAFGIDQTPMSYVALAAGQRLRRAWRGASPPCVMWPVGTSVWLGRSRPG